MGKLKKLISVVKTIVHCKIKYESEDGNILSLNRKPGHL